MYLGNCSIIEPVQRFHDSDAEEVHVMWTHTTPNSKKHFFDPSHFLPFLHSDYDISMDYTFCGIY